MALRITPVKTRRQLKRFVKVPFRLHRDHPKWVPPLILERMTFLNRRRNPFLELTEDPEVARALLDAAAGWVAERGRQRILGPMDFTTNDELGLLIEGHERRPMILQPWHPPYYQRMVEDEGYGKTMDLLMWWLAMGELKQGDQFHEFIHQAAEKSRTEHGIHLRNMRTSDMEAEIRRFMDV